MRTPRKATGFTVLIGISMCFLYACAPTKIPPKDRPITGIQSTLDRSIEANKQVAKALEPPLAVSEALVPSLSVKAPAAAELNAERFDVSVDDVPAKAFFMGLVEGTPYNMVIDPKLEGTISLHLKDVTIPDVMESVRDAYGYEYEQNRLGYRVLSSGLQTQIFTINYLNVQRSGSSQTEVSSGISSDVNSTNGSGTTSSSSIIPSAADASTTASPLNNSGGGGTSSTMVATQTTSDFWGSLKTSLTAIVGTEDGRSVVLNPQAGVIVARAKPAELREVAAYLDKIQNSMNRQVLIEAKILEITLNSGFQQGIDWTLFGVEQQGNRDLKESGFSAFGIQADGDPTTNTDLNIFSAHASSGDNFDATIKLLSVQGDVQVLSSPRIATVNNQKALIKVGEDQFFVTNVSSTTTTSAAAPTTGQDVELTPFFSGIALDITPQIDSNGDVTLHVHPTVVKVTDQNKSIDLGTDDTLKLPLALSEVRETDSIVHAKNGQVVAIGGLMTNFYADRNAMTPGFGELPVAGNLFKDTERRWQKRELVILLRPIVINEKSATEQLEASQKEFKSMQSKAQEMEKPVSMNRWFTPVS